ncbi:PREDICTED: polyadenylate-binding protein 2-B-like [Nicrophorus vespilloides]|uniref:Polyadenylate-binding protein 2-B-like n=1 Tax=Nicrophorus vespilloides TaxID=110193 RepID=A0ABM1N6G1_NICVS|nr:PREDICTED: polyadenylate-binding protein 2-B-like [Nicrophorus vespilloides]
MASKINNSTVITTDAFMLLEEPSGMDSATVDEAEFMAIKQTMKELDDEMKKLKKIEKQFNISATLTASPLKKSWDAKIMADIKSVYVGNVDYGTTPAVLQAHFHGCGVVKRITIPVSKFDGTPKGFAYIEFSEPSSVDLAMSLDQSLLRGRHIKVVPKRTNKPGFSTTNRPPRSDAFGYHSRGAYRPIRDFTGRFSLRRGYGGQRGGFSRFTPY